MTLDTVIMLVGAAIAALPFLGFPQRWDSVIVFLLGVVVVGLGVAVRRRGVKAGLRPIAKKTDAFVESKAMPAHAPEDQA